MTSAASRFWRWLVWNLRYRRKRLDICEYLADLMRKDMQR